MKIFGKYQELPLEIYIYGVPKYQVGLMLGKRGVRDFYDAEEEEYLKTGFKDWNVELKQNRKAKAKREGTQEFLDTHRHQIVLSKDLKGIKIRFTSSRMDEEDIKSLDLIPIESAVGKEQQAKIFYKFDAAV